MPVKPRIGLKEKREAVAKTFGPVDPEDIEIINFFFERRHCATVPGRIGRDLAYVVALDELEQAITTALDGILECDGERIFRESVRHLARHLRDVVDISMAKPRRPS